MSLEFIEPIIPLLLFVIGAMIGSFGNVVIYRWPKGESVVLPSSRCQKCQNKIAFYDNIPILSWILLRGKCRKCGEKISIRYPLVEFLTAIMFVLVYFFVGFNWTLLEYLIFVSALIMASFIDIDHFLLPDVITLSGIILGLVGAAINPERQFMDALIGVLFGGGFLWAIAYLYFLIKKEEGMGGGDIKLLAWIGSILGWQSIPFVILSASIIGSVLGLALAGKNNKGLKTVIPFGPYLALGAVLFICGGDFLAHSYLQIFFPEL